MPGNRRTGVGWVYAPLALLLGAGSADAQPAPDAKAQLQARTLAAACAACHGTNGRALEGAVVPGLAGMPAATLVEQMKAFKAGTRPSTVMQQLAKGFDEAQIGQLAAYFAAQPRQ